MIRLITGIPLVIASVAWSTALIWLQKLKRRRPGKYEGDQTKDVGFL